MIRTSAHRTARARVATAAALPLLLAAALTGCGDDATDERPAAVRTASNGDRFNDADVSFASEMVPHHADALVMVDLTQGRELSLEMADLTEDIRAAQAPEIEQMVDWLTAWGEEVPETSRDHVNSHDMGEMDDMGGGMGDGMGMDPEDLAALEDSDGTAFEQVWLQMMIEHHEGAIEVAQDEQADGLSDDAVALAESIESGHTAEIDRMETMLGR